MRLAIAFGYAVSDDDRRTYRQVLGPEIGALGADDEIVLRGDRHGAVLAPSDRLTALLARSRQIPVLVLSEPGDGDDAAEARDTEIAARADRLILFIGMTLTPDLARLWRAAIAAGVPVTVWEIRYGLLSRVEARPP